MSEDRTIDIDKLDTLLDGSPYEVAKERLLFELAPKVCNSCGRDLNDCTESSDGRVDDNQYIVLQSIAIETIGHCWYECGTCVEKMGRTPLPGSE